MDSSNKCFCDRENCRILRDLIKADELTRDSLNELTRMETIEETGETKKEFRKNQRNVKAKKPKEQQQQQHQDHKTTYLETLIHHFKGNVGPGCYAMGDAFKNGGLLLAPALTISLAILYVHSQHMLLSCSQKVRERFMLERRVNYPETVELCMESGSESIRKWSKFSRRVCNAFICTIQLGYCCIYFLFIGKNIRQIFENYGYHFQLDDIMIVSLVPILIISLIMDLKYLVPLSAIANICMIGGIAITFYYSSLDLPPLETRNYVASLSQLPLFFGTAVFAFEGISLVLPLQNSMRKPKNFSIFYGVLNVGMLLITTIFVCIGFMGYLKYGEAVRGSLSLNLPNDQFSSQLVKLATSLGVLLGYPLQFFIAIQIMYPGIQRKFKIAQEFPRTGEVIFRTILVFVTFLIAKFIPKLNLLLSLLGAFCSTGLSLVFPPIIHLILNHEHCGWLVISKDIFILLFAMVGFSTGTFASINEIIKSFSK